MCNYRELSKISVNMTEIERSDYLREKYIVVVDGKSDSTIGKLSDNKKESEIYDILLEYGERQNIFKEYYMIGDTNLSGYFSKSNLKESLHKCGNMYYFPYVIFNMNNLLQKSIKIEEHFDIKGGNAIKMIHELISLLKLKSKENPSWPQQWSAS